MTITESYAVIKLALSLTEFFPSILFHYFPPNIFIRFVSSDFWVFPVQKKNIYKPSKKSAQAGNKFDSAQLSLFSALAGFLPGLLINHEDRGDIFLQNVGLSLNHLMLQHR